MARPPTPKPRVFISSVVEGFGQFRAAARAAVSEAGGEPVLINEDFAASATSSRNACLDAVESSDIYVGVLGVRGGWTAPSGMLVVEEEWRHARSKKRPALFFLQTGARDADAERLAATVSDYVDGTLRRTFTTPEDLRREIVRALSPLISAEDHVATPSDEFLKAFGAGSRFNSSEPSLRVVIAPERREEIVDPVRISSERFKRDLLEIGHRSGVDLLDYSVGKIAGLEGDTLVITQQAPMSARSDSEAVRLALSERGILTAEVIATESGGRDSMNLMYSLVLSTERVGAITRRVLAFYNAVMEGLDPHKRQQTFYYNVTLEHLSHQTLIRNPQPRSSYPMNMRSGQQPVVAFPEPRIIIRQDLGNPDEEIERVITLLLRNSSA